MQKLQFCTKFIRVKIIENKVNEYEQRFKNKN